MNETVNWILQINCQKLGLIRKKLSVNKLNFKCSPIANKLFKSYDFNDFEVDEIEKALSGENKGEFDIKVNILLAFLK